MTALCRCDGVRLKSEVNRRKRKRYRTHFPNASRDGREYYIRVTPVCVGGGRETENECIIMIVK